MVLEDKGLLMKQNDNLESQQVNNLAELTLM